MNSTHLPSEVKLMEINNSKSEDTRTIDTHSEKVNISTDANKKQSVDIFSCPKAFSKSNEILVNAPNLTPEEKEQANKLAWEYVVKKNKLEDL